LKVATSNAEPEGDYSKIIYVSVVVNKVVGGNNYPMDKLVIKYNTKGRDYILLSDSIYSSDEPVYKAILDKLDETYNDVWGFTAN
jgi:hypothetical protein